MTVDLTLRVSTDFKIQKSISRKNLFLMLFLDSFILRACLHLSVLAALQATVLPVSSPLRKITPQLGSVVEADVVSLQDVYRTAVGV